MAVSKASIEIPYGSPALNDRAASIAKRHVVSDISALVIDILADRVPELAVLHAHRGLLHPGNNVGMLDFSVSGLDQLSNLDIELIAWKIRGGNGEPLAADFGNPALVLQFHLTGEGELAVRQQNTPDGSWTELAQALRQTISRWWMGAVADGMLTKLTSNDMPTRKRAIERWLRSVWNAERLAPAAAMAKVKLIDEEDELQATSSSLDVNSQRVYLVTKELAERLAEIGENAGVVLGLPYWSTPLLDAPEASNPLQHLAFLELGQQNTTELTKE